MILLLVVLLSSRKDATFGINTLESSSKRGEGKLMFRKLEGGNGIKMTNWDSFEAARDDVMICFSCFLLFLCQTEREKGGEDLDREERKPQFSNKIIK